MTLPQILRILWARRMTILWLGAGLFALALTASLLLPKTYKASSDVLINLGSADAISGTVAPHAALAAKVATQVDVIESRRVAQQVVKILALEQNEGWVRRWRDDADGRGNIDEWIADELLEDLAVRADSEGSIIRVNFEADTASFAAQAANAFVQAYLNTATMLQIDPARQNAEFFQARVGEARTRLEATKKALSDYQKENNIIDAADRFDVENDRLAALSQELVQLESRAAQARALGQRTQSRDALPEVLSNPVVQSLRQRLADAEGTLSQLSNRLGTQHPTYISQVQQVNSLRGKLKAEIDRQASAIVQSSRVTTNRTREIRESLESQRQKVIDLKGKRDRMDVLRNEVASAEQAFQLISERGTVNSLATENRSTNASVLTKATTPLKASSPKLALNSVVGGMLGALLGAAIALFSESSRPQIRSVADLTDAFDLPVLVSLPDGNLGVSKRSSKSPRVLPKISHLGSSSAATPRLENKS
ncbi:MAG: Wzz/FepE/Etk N-terminal domain-containing protein [Burkholderiaceae bacterium]